MGLWTVASTCSTWRERCQNVPYGKWPYITTTALSMIRSFWLHGQARYGIVVEIAITSALSLINTFRSGGRAWVVLAEFYHLLFANVERLCTRSYPNSTSLLVILMYRREPSLHLNPRAEWIWWSSSSLFLCVKLTLSTWVSGCHVSLRMPLWYSREGFYRHMSTCVLWKQRCASFAFLGTSSVLEPELGSLCTSFTAGAFRLTRIVMTSSLAAQKMFNQAERRKPSSVDCQCALMCFPSGSIWRHLGKSLKNQKGISCQTNLAMSPYKCRRLWWYVIVTDSHVVIILINIHEAGFFVW